MKLKIFFVLYCTVFLFSGAAAAGIYKYTDQKGIVRFTDDPGKVPEHLRSTVEIIPEVPADNAASSQEIAPEKEKDLKIDQTTLKVKSLNQRAKERLERTRKELEQSYLMLSEKKTYLTSAWQSVPRRPRHKWRKQTRLINNQFLDLNGKIAAFNERRQAFNSEARDLGVTTVPELLPIPYKPPINE